MKNRLYNSWLYTRLQEHRGKKDKYLKCFLLITNKITSHSLFWFHNYINLYFYWNTYTE